MKPSQILLLIVLCCGSFSSAFSQTAAGVSDEDLKRYALTMDSVKVMQETLTQIITQTVQQNGNVPVQRYNELFKIAGDEAKLTAANATQEERDFLKEVADLRQYNINRINAAYQGLAKDYVGLKAFNAIKKSIATDEKLKARYDAISQEVQSSRGSSNIKG